MAKKYYGDDAYVVKIESESDYDDQGHHYDSISSFYVCDEAGSVLSFDKVERVLS